MTRIFTRLSTWLDGTAFPRIDEPEAESRKVAVLRVATGLVLVWRCALLLRDSSYYFDPIHAAGGVWPLQALASAAQLALAIGLTLGVAPAACAALLMATHAAYSIWTGTYNLAPMLLVPTLGAFALLETGRLGLTGHPRPSLPAAHYRAVYLILFIAYGGWNFQAVLYHVRDAYWIGGHTAGVLFTNSYLSEFYEMFRAWESAAPFSYRCFSAAVVCLQTVFQLAMLPLMAARWGARYVQIWGWAFILGSLADLQLSVLPLVEAVMWGLLFLPARWFAWAGRRAAAAGARTAPGRGRSAALLVYFGVYGTLLPLYFGNAIVSFAIPRRLPGWTDPVFLYTGLVAPNVFNRTDLTMGDCWAVLERLDGEHRGVVPFNGPAGERLAYHRSDLLYFANSLRWRRSMIDLGDLAAYHRPGGGGYEYARQIALYDYRRHGVTGAGLYRVTLFCNHSSDNRRGSNPTRYQPSLVLEFTLRVGTETPESSPAPGSVRSAPANNGHMATDAIARQLARVVPSDQRIAHRRRQGEDEEDRVE